MLQPRKYNLEDIAFVSARRSRNMQIYALHHAGENPREFFEKDWHENGEDGKVLRAIELIDEIEAYSEWALCSEIDPPTGVPLRGII